MIKTIHLIRHGKSSWQDPTLADIDRPLNQRGIDNCKIMADYIYQAGCSYHYVLCSPAERAQATIELISQNTAELAINWHIDDRLYHFDSTSLYTVCKTLDESIHDIVIIGHNPALTDFCNELSNGQIKNIPTCGYVQLNTETEHNWLALSKMNFKITQFLTPKICARNMD